MTVSNLGPSAVGAGDQFRLFVANSYSCSFASITLPPLGVGLTWTNKLLVDGSIQVIGPPRFTAVVIVSTNLVISGSGGTTNAAYTVLTSTNVALAVPSWTHLLTNQFDNLGNFIFSNGISPSVPRRFYRLQVP